MFSIYIYIYIYIYKRTKRFANKKNVAGKKTVQFFYMQIYVKTAKPEKVLVSAKPEITIVLTIVTLQIKKNTTCRTEVQKIIKQITDKR